MEEIKQLTKDYEETKRLFQEIENNARSITKFLEKLFSSCIYCPNHSKCNELDTP